MTNKKRAIATKTGLLKFSDSAARRKRRLGVFPTDIAASLTQLSRHGSSAIRTARHGGRLSRINTNIPSLRTVHRLTANQDALALSLERLSTGIKINRGADDPAGLIGSEALRSNMAGLTQAIDNTQRADNVISTAEGALNEVSTLLLQLQSLTVQTANTGGLTADEVAANQLQADTILNTIDRIANTTRFAGVKLLDGSRSYQTSAIAASAVANVRVHSASFNADRDPISVDIDVLKPAATASVSYVGTAITSALVLEVAGVKGVERLYFGSGTNTSAIAKSINEVSAFTGVSATLSTGGLHVDSQGYGSKYFVSVRSAGTQFITDQKTGTDAQLSVNGVTALADGKLAQIRGGGIDVSFELTDAINSSAGKTRFYVTGGGNLFQIGQNVRSSDQVDVALESVATSQLGDDRVGRLMSLGSGGANALKGGNTVNAQLALDAAIKQVSTLRGRLGSLQKNVLQTNLNSLAVTLENVTASNSKIRDTDFAAETASMTRSQILVQATQSVLAQANTTPQSVLALLGR